MNNTKNRKLKFNIIDFLIILIVIGVALIFVFRSNMVNSFTSAPQTISYTVRISDVQKESFDLVEVGSTLYCNDDDSILGTIKGKRFEEASMYTVLANGDIVKTYQPDRIDIYLEVEASGTVDEDGCMIDGTYFIASGKMISCYVDKLYFNVEVRDAFEKV